LSWGHKSLAAGCVSGTVSGCSWNGSAPVRHQLRRSQSRTAAPGGRLGGSRTRCARWERGRRSRTSADVGARLAGSDAGRATGDWAGPTLHGSARHLGARAPGAGANCSADALGPIGSGHATGTPLRCCMPNPVELAVAAYVQACTGRDPVVRARLLESCLAADVRMVMRTREVRGRAARVKELERFLVDPRLLRI